MSIPESSLDYYCKHQQICDLCPLKPHIRKCGMGWHISCDASETEKAAATLIFMADAMLKGEKV